MDTPEVTEVATGLQFPEGPVWMPDGTVLCVELKRRTVDRIHPDGRIETIATPGGSPNGLAIGPDGAAYVCNSGGWDFVDIMGMTVTSTLQPSDYSGGRIERVDLDTGGVRVLYTECDGHPLMGPNDLVFDAAGGMWFTDHGKIRDRDRDEGGVYYAGGRSKDRASSAGRVPWATAARCSPACPGCSCSTRWRSTAPATSWWARS
jgi:gluconolactonase